MGSSVFERHFQKPEQVNGKVLAFHALDGNQLLVLGTDENLWLEHAPFGVVPPRHEQVDEKCRPSMQSPRRFMRYAATATH
jgi:hypothetical protein